MKIPFYIVFIILLLCCFSSCKQENLDGSWQRFSYGKPEGFIQFKGDSLIIDPNTIFESHHAIVVNKTQFQIKKYKDCDITFDYKLVDDTLYNLTNTKSRPFWVRQKTIKN